MNFRAIDGAGRSILAAKASTPPTPISRASAKRTLPTGYPLSSIALIRGQSATSLSERGDAAVPNQKGLSGFMYAWGQFIDHDLDLTRSDGTTHIDVQIPAGDPNFPDGSSISITRAVTDLATGAGTGQPATAVNSVTGWLDASMVYGSDAQTAANLRLPDGHLKSSAGGNLPIVDGTFVAGDERAAENPSLTALQTLFLREHNQQVDLLHEQHPEWTGDQLYNQARAIVNAEIAHITYSEFLPHLLGPTRLAPITATTRVWIRASRSNLPARLFAWPLDCFRGNGTDRQFRSCNRTRAGVEGHVLPVS